MVFVVLNSVAVLYANRLPAWSKGWSEYSRTHWDSAAVRAADWGVFLFSWYPYLLGLDQRYTMFSRVARDDFTWRYYVVDADGRREELLPEADHRTGKFQLNLYSNEEGRRRYATYLCRHAPAGAGRSWEHLDWEWWFRGFAARDLALAAGSHWNGASWLWKTERVECPR